LTDGPLARALAAGPALEAGEWSLGEAALELVLGEVAAGRERVVECGSGRSTVMIARLLRELDRGTLHSLEHDPGWAALARERIETEGLEERATVIEAPLERDPCAARDCRWYARSALQALPGSGIDLLLIDGPPASPGSGRERSRYPALPRLASQLAPGAAVVLDDAARAGERWALERWRRELGLDLGPGPGGVAFGRWPGCSPPGCAGMYVQDHA
jgi:predicted O-methyltransferase YrrM